MAATKEEAKAELQKLVDRFREQYASYKRTECSDDSRGYPLTQAGGCEAGIRPAVNANPVLIRIALNCEPSFVEKHVNQE